MKKFILLTLCLGYTFIKAQSVPATYVTDFKAVLEAAKKTFKTDKVDNGKPLEGDDFVMEYQSKAKFQSAMQSHLVLDKDQVLNHHVVFDAGKDKAAAKALLLKFIETTKPILPPNYKENQLTNMKYVDNTSYTYDFNSDDFYQQASKPVVIMGLLEQDGKYVVNILIMGPSV